MLGELVGGCALSCEVVVLVVEHLLVHHVGGLRLGGGLELGLKLLLLLLELELLLLKLQLLLLQLDLGLHLRL